MPVHVRYLWSPLKLDNSHLAYSSLLVPIIRHTLNQTKANTVFIKFAQEKLCGSKYNHNQSREGKSYTFSGISA